MVPFTNCHKCGNHVVPRSVFVVEGSFAEPVCERIDTESRLDNISPAVFIGVLSTYMMHKNQSNDSRVNESTFGISPSDVSDYRRQYEAHEQDQRKVMLVLPFDDGIMSQVADIGNTRLATRLYQHPANVGEPKAFVCIVRVEFSVGVSMVSTVTSRPPFDRALEGASAQDSENVLQRKRCVECTVSP